MKEEVFKAALAGLLHDIGKFAQRAGEGKHLTWNDQTNDQTKDEFKYEHALYTDWVVEQIVPSQWRADVRAAAGRHHKPQAQLDQVVCLADRLSAGERSDERKDHPKQLQSIFCSLTGLKDENGQPIPVPDKKYLPLKKLAIEKEVIFPVDTIDDSHGTYKELWDGFARDAAALKIAFEQEGANKAAYLESLLNLMQQYTWCIPSAYYNAVPDVSLYDHSRMTAALAACLAQQPEDKIQVWLKQEAQAEPVALLVGGDISGVQKFIYTLSSSGAAKALRGRSFYLQLLTVAVAHYTLNQLGLPTTNLIYAGGGNFFLLAGVKQGNILQNTATIVSKELVRMHQGELHLILSSTPVSAGESDRRKFHRVWSRLHQEELNRAKLQPLVNLGEIAFLEQVGSPLGEGGDNDNVCAISGQEIPNGKGVEIESGGDVIRVSDFSDSLIKLGNRLAKATHLVTIHSSPQTNMEVDTWEDGLQAFGYITLPIDANRHDFDNDLTLPEKIDWLELTTVSPPDIRN